MDFRDFSLIELNAMKHYAIEWKEILSGYIDKFGDEIGDKGTFILKRLRARAVEDIENIREAKNNL